jgi:hypothetical protein
LDVQLHRRKKDYQRCKGHVWNLTVKKKTGGLRPGEVAKFEKHCFALQGEFHWFGYRFAINIYVCDMEGKHVKGWYLTSYSSQRSDGVLRKKISKKWAL